MWKKSEVEAEPLSIDHLLPRRQMDPRVLPIVGLVVIIVILLLG